MSSSVFNGSRHRLLDYDDFLILRALSTGCTVMHAANVLGVTQPAVTQRLRKMSFVFGEQNIMKYHGRTASLTDAGMHAAGIAIRVLALVEASGSPASTTEPT